MPSCQKLLLPLLSPLLCVNSVYASDNEETDSAKSYSPYAEISYPTNVYWGDTHVHTNLSADAYNFGNRKLGPEDAYRFAKGETVIANNGMAVKLQKPLDFLVIADHAENIAVMQGLENKNADLLDSPLGRQWTATLREVNQTAQTDIIKSVELSLELYVSTLFGESSIVDGPYLASVWKNKALLADAHNVPGEFTAFSGYEWSASGNHRVVIFKDGMDKVTQVVPFSGYDSADPEDLWAYFADYEQKTDGQVLAIPHNSNISMGITFALVDASGTPLSMDYAKRRSRWEPLVEVTQIKGDSETHPLLSPKDEFADYETLENNYRLKAGDPYASWVNNRSNEDGSPKPGWYQFSYARSALKLGLGQQHQFGANPFKFGMIGSTDSHTSLATGDDSNFFGKLTYVEPNAKRVTSGWHGPNSKKEQKPWSMGWRMSASGYAGVWAEENTRQSLFAAMKRKEVYATTGPRMTVRFFGGWNYQSDDSSRPDFARIGYSKGVPMGGDLTEAPKGKTPSFLIRAVKDPDGANLDRVQVIKGWHDKSGELHEKVYNVALSDNRKENWRGKVKPVGSTVDIKDASYTNTIGDPELAVVWTDPDFDHNELAFYYVRVLEIPTPRWTAYDAKFFGITDIPEEVPMVTQERAYTSPIWYSPSVRQEAVMSTVKQENN